MRNTVKVFGLILCCGLAVLAFDSFHLFDGFSQTITKTSANVSVITNGSGIPKASTPPISIETRGGGMPQPKQRDGLCGSGFVEIPTEFKQLFSRYEETLKDKPDGIKEFYKLKNEVKFYGFTFSAESVSDSDEGDSLCNQVKPKPEEIKFVSGEVNDLLVKFISAFLFNENQVLMAKNRISGVADNEKDSNKLELCQDVECGTENLDGEKKSFDLVNTGYARQFSTSMLLTNVRNEIRRVKLANSQERELVDSEVNRIIDEAFKVAITKTRK